MTIAKRAAYNALRGEPRSHLIHSLPQATPYCIYIDPSNRCNFSCQFCPTGQHQLLEQVGRPQGMMSMSLFERIVDSIVDLTDKTGELVQRLQLYKDGEPLLNPNLVKMIRYAKQRNVTKQLETTTNGSLLNKELADQLVDAGLDLIRVSVVHVNDSNYYKYTKSKKAGYDRIRKNVEQLFRRNKEAGANLTIYVKLIDLDRDKNVIEKFVRDFSSIADYVHVDQLMGWSSSNRFDFTLGTTPTTAMDSVTHRKKRVICPEPFTKLAVNFNGEVSVCCVDWKMDTVVGDLKTESISAIWNGHKLKQFRMTHLQDEETRCDACACCDYLQGFSEFCNLDEFREVLKESYM